jgi:threonine dehydrogenase-like Zn-dependent dehydrogenase
VYGGIGDFGLVPEDRVLIFGAGPVGLSFVKFCNLLECAGWGWSIRSRTNASGRSAGADEVFSPDELAAASARFAGFLDAVVDAVGSERIVNSALPLIRRAARSASTASSPRRR